MKKTLDVLTSAFNEQDGIREFLNSTVETLESQSSYDWRIRICDNGSTDSTWNLIVEMARLNPRIIGYKMVRSFGFDNALTFALDQTSADLVITMTSDLQDPPEIIAKFLQEYETGHNHVAARVTDRKSISLRRRVMTNFFYFLAEKLTDGMYPRNVSDFRLMSRSVYSDVIKLREQNRFLRGIVAWTGHKCKIIEIERPERQYGSSKFDSLSLRKVVPWALSSIFSFTPKPLEFVAIASILFSGATFLLLLTLTVFWLIVGVPFAGYGSIVGGVILLFSTLFLILGIFSLYLNLIFNEIKARPLYLVEGNTQANN